MPFVPVPEENEQWKQYREPCRHPEHDPPGMIVLPPGLHRWQCPACGAECTFRVNAVECSV